MSAMMVCAVMVSAEVVVAAMVSVRAGLYHHVVLVLLVEFLLIQLLQLLEFFLLELLLVQLLLLLAGLCCRWLRGEGVVAGRVHWKSGRGHLGHHVGTVRSRLEGVDRRRAVLLSVRVEVLMLVLMLVHVLALMVAAGMLVVSSRPGRKLLSALGRQRRVGRTRQGGNFSH